MALFYHCRGKR